MGVIAAVFLLLITVPASAQWGAFNRGEASPATT